MECYWRNLFYLDVVLLMFMFIDNKVLEKRKKKFLQDYNELFNGSTRWVLVTEDSCSDNSKWCWRRAYQSSFKCFSSALIARVWFTAYTVPIAFNCSIFFAVSYLLLHFVIRVIKRTFASYTPVAPANRTWK